ncbi:hypothetical protein BDF14DRAFT_1075022 [Spinellus fusiger]|nr:hypothetical protein BDF14DRAFT_1075022 [Spinellus fusiger]
MIEPDFLPQSEINLPAAYSNQTPEKYLESLIEFFEKYRHLIDIHVVDFLTYHQWELLDVEWREVLLPSKLNKDSSEGSDLLALIQIASENTSNCYWPASLQEYIQTSKDIALPRTFPFGC